MKYKVGDEFVFIEAPKHTISDFAGERCRVTRVHNSGFSFVCSKIASNGKPWSAGWEQVEDTIPSYINDSPLMKALR